MADYLFLPKILPSFSAECDLTSVVSNRSHNTDPFARHKVALYLQRRDQLIWSLMDVIEFRDGVSATIRTQDYDLAVGEVIVGVPLAVGDPTPPTLSTLPKPHSRRNDRAPIEERVAVRFVYDGARSSYQGDYPYALTTRATGSVVSLGSLLLDQPATAQTYVVLINVYGGELKEKRCFTFHMQDVTSKKIVTTSSYYHNSSCTIAVPKEYNDPEKEAFFFSRDTIGIPLFVTSSTSGRESTLSIEHTHPPHEYFWQKDRVDGGAIVKSTWLKMAASDA